MERNWRVQYYVLGMCLYLSILTWPPNISQLGGGWAQPGEQRWSSPWFHDVLWRPRSTSPSSWYIGPKVEPKMLLQYYSASKLYSFLIRRGLGS